MTTDSVAKPPVDADKGRIRRVPLIALLAAQGLSLAGNAITLIVVPLHVLQDTGSVLATGVAGVFATVPVIVGGALGGVVVDRLGFRTAAILADISSGITVLAIPVLAFTVGLPFWALLALVFFSGLFDTPGETAKSAMLPDLAESGGIRLAAATGAQSAVSRSAGMIGATVAALSILWIGSLGSLVLDAATFAISALLLWVFVPQQAPSGADAVTSKGEPTPASSQDPGDADPAVPQQGYWRELASGIRYLVSEPLVRNVVLLVVVTNCIDAAGFTVLRPAYAHTVSPDGALLGVMVALFSFGAFAGASLYTWVGHRLPRRMTLTICFVLCGGPPYLAMAVDLPVPAVLTTVALAGLAAGSINPLLSTVILEHVPRAIRARVLGALTTGVSAGMPVGALAAGIVVSSAGLVPTLLIAGVIYIIVTLAPLTGRSWRALDAR